MAQTEVEEMEVGFASIVNGTNAEGKEIVGIQWSDSGNLLIEYVEGDI